jgi:hypothetical protein
MGVKEIRHRQGTPARQLHLKQAQQAFTRRHFNPFPAYRYHCARRRSIRTSGRFSTPNTQHLITPVALRHWPGIEGAHLPLDLGGVLRPIDGCLAFVNLGGVTSQAFVLRFGMGASCRHLLQGQADRLSTQDRQFIMQGLGSFITAYRARKTQQHRPGVEAGIHLNNSDAGLTVAGEDGALDRRRTPPAR